MENLCNNPDMADLHIQVVLTAPYLGMGICSTVINLEIFEQREKKTTLTWRICIFRWRSLYQIDNTSLPTWVWVHM